MNFADERYPECGDEPKVVVFLGSPAPRQSYRNEGKLAGDICNVAWHASGGGIFNGGIRTTLLGDLEQHSSALFAINDNFIQRAALQIVSFYKENITLPIGAVVSKLLITVSSYYLLYTYTHVNFNAL